jgi:hypothetical protein
MCEADASEADAQQYRGEKFTFSIAKRWHTRLPVDAQNVGMPCDDDDNDDDDDDDDDSCSLFASNQTQNLSRIFLQRS